MGILVTFRLKHPRVRPKSAIYTPSQDDALYTRVTPQLYQAFTFLVFVDHVHAIFFLT